MKSYTETYRYLKREGPFDAASAPGTNASESAGDNQHWLSEGGAPQIPAPAYSRLSVGATHTQSEHTALATIRPVPAPALVPMPSEDALNQINAEIRGDTVYVSALLDKDGLKILAKKVAALSDFLADD
ncbi:hypothetical protein [Phaeobacter inhibens]|uniref:hypothetical protein n=1 Tax=Phaeobacter inhibens TaxID=221822 RepID=UPI001E39C262|nr:hypothetical protein [Phaeobacter inhibens]WHP68361.1 hypothetical protein QMZ01_17920 [Phaeobacter inhibens]